MKQRLTLLVLQFSFITCFAQVTNIKYGRWSDKATWSNSSIPDYGDVIELNFNVVVDINAYCRSLNVNGHDVTVNSGVHLIVVGEDSSNIPQLNSGLIAYYPFNGNVKDASGNGYDLTESGPLLTSNRFGDIQKAYRFNGISDYLAIPKMLKADSLRDLTISVWINTEAVNRSVFLSFLTKLHRCSNFMAFGQNGMSYGTWHHMVTQQSPTYCEESIISDTIDNPLNKWSHFVLVQRYRREDYGSSYLYVEYYNSKKLKIDASGFSPPPIASSLSSGGIVGGESISGHFENSFDWFKGAVDDIRIYDRALSDSEILQLYNLHE